MIVLILKFRKDKTITHGPNVIFFSQINVYYVQTNYNEVVVLRRWRRVDEKVTGTRKTHTRDREMSEKMKRLKMKMEVQEITFNYFARPQPRDLNFYVMMMMAIQKILLSVVSKFVVGVCDGLDACEISRPEIMSQSAPGYT